MPLRILFVYLGLFTVSVICLTANEIEAERSGWSANPNTQYHIQTDEGPERFFRYQTQNGQYRKEKRLADGTVVGTEGWLDALGYLRLKDYIADHEGFRILRSKMVYVGRDRPIQDALAEAKKVPAQTGLLAKPRRPPNPFRQETNDVVPLSGNSIDSSYYVSSTVRPIAVRPNAVYYEAKPTLQNLDIYPRPFSGYYSTQTARPVQILQSPSTSYNSRPYSSGLNYAARPVSSAELPTYDGTHRTANGFEYYLKRQYHEEEEKPYGDRVGSFGYIDPFGIRRVIYYKTDPIDGGFVHKKNNRYVGFRATPYDPLPPNIARISRSSSVTRSPITRASISRVSRSSSSSTTTPKPLNVTAKS
ncbi:uncharacterized protein [Prorops nasuta]|uniref:uncharacterized protein isoform X2 n=1 Tax=Prorops nasuta TaxID=863751 RepID=UPI0034CD448E